MSYSHVEEEKKIPNQGKLLSDLWDRLSYRAVIKGSEGLSVGLETAQPLRWGLRNNTLLLCFSVGSNVSHIFTLSKTTVGIQNLDSVSYLWKELFREGGRCVHMFQSN